VVQGQPAVQGPVMLVANHISWLDIPVLHAARYCRFISKSDVQGWPHWRPGHGGGHAVHRAQLAARRHAHGARHAKVPGGR
jgi:1-acyl-sn-glycerol-3-phosphate acyltransferase